MVFASLTFLYIFLPATLFLYYIIPSIKYKNGILIFASLVFYAWGEPIWVSLLLISASADFIHGRLIEKYRGRWQSKAGLISSIIVNLGLLAAFKYSSMAVESINEVFGISLHVPRFDLPIGISFYTFQTLSYSIDVYRGDTPAQKSYWNFLLFVSLFHQLVAGPIVRYRDIARGIEHRKWDLSQFSGGVSRFVIGLGKKVLIANVAGELAAPFLDGSFADLTVTGAWFGMFLFALQIYFDFSGYSDMAIGLGKMFGFEYKENFNYPYVSRSATEFWRRWHISLGSFFRDYLYIPLGGNRKHVFINLLIVWFLTGLWHGAHWNFVLWGLYYGILIYIEKQFARLHIPRLPKIAGRLYMIVITLFGWSLFYFTDLSRLWLFLRTMAGFSGAPLFGPRVEISIMNNLVFICISSLLCLPVLPRIQSILKNKKLVQIAAGITVPVFNLLLVGVSTIMLVGSSYNPFLYFRF